MPLCPGLPFTPVCALLAHRLGLHVRLTHHETTLTHFSLNISATIRRKLILCMFSSSGIKKLSWLLMFFYVVIPAMAQDATPDQTKIVIDSIKIVKNWRTKDKIIREELGFGQGDAVTRGDLDTMMIRIWNIGNFARVTYELDTLPDGGNLLKVLAKDAFTVVPVISFNGSQKDWRLSLGMSDDNFLGRNIRFHISGTMGTNDKSFNMGINVPRQLLYKNMSVSTNLSIGKGINYRYHDGQKSSVIAYHKRQISGGISNPWNEDFKYRFSPNFGWSVFQHVTDSSLVQSEVPFSRHYKVNYLALSLSESVGYIKRMRHQKDGYKIGIGIGAGIGLDAHSPFYYNIGGGAEYHKLFNKVVQFSAKYSSGYTSSVLPSLLFYKGAGDVKGIVTGEISGQAFYTASLGWHFTYINRDWFAMEQSFFVDVGNGKDCYTDLYRNKPLYGVGTGFYFNIPMIPWMSMRLYFTYSGKHSNWFRLEI